MSQTAEKASAVLRTITLLSHDGVILEQIGHYKLLRKLGTGAMGSVYLAVDPATGKNVAIKVLSLTRTRSQELVGRFLHEAEALSRLSHPNIVGAISVGQENQLHYFVMEYCVGETLDRIIRHHGRLGWQRALLIALQIADGLQYAHNHGCIHRDITPGNIVVTNEGVTKLLDFGLSKEVGGDSATLTKDGDTVGTPHYISPEQACGKTDLDGRTDIYGLGCTLFHMITGSTPYMGTQPAVVMAKHLTEPVPEARDCVPDLPENLCQLLRRMMSKDRVRRQANCEELINDIHTVIKGKPLRSAEKPPSRAGSAIQSAVGKHSGLNSAVGKTSTSKPAPAKPAPKQDGTRRYEPVTSRTSTSEKPRSVGENRSRSRIEPALARRDARNTRTVARRPSNDAALRLSENTGISQRGLTAQVWPALLTPWMIGVLLLAAAIGAAVALALRT